MKAANIFPQAIKSLRASHWRRDGFEQGPWRPLRSNLTPSLSPGPLPTPFSRAGMDLEHQLQRMRVGGGLGVTHHLPARSSARGPGLSVPSPPPGLRWGPRLSPSPPVSPAPRLCLPRSLPPHLHLVRAMSSAVALRTKDRIRRKHRGPTSFSSGGNFRGFLVLGTAGTATGAAERE